MDAVKALAILLVVYGHTIQYISGTDFWNNRIFQIIYSVHMPMFFVVSGFFFVGTHKKTFREFITKKATALLLPCLVWATLSGIASLALNGDLRAFFLQIITPQGWPFWFLKGLFVVQLVAWLCLVAAQKVVKRHFVIYAAALSMAVYLIPNMDVPRVMLPFFWVGWFIRRHYEQLLAHSGVIAVVSGLIFVILLQFWDREGMRFYAGTTLNIYTYFSGLSLPWKDWLMLLFRILIGVSGSVAIIALMHLFQHVPRYVLQVGQSTEAVYILQACLLEHLVGDFIAIKTNWMTPLQQLQPVILFGVALPIIALLYVCVCTMLYLPTHRLPHLAVPLFGGYYHKEK